MENSLLLNKHPTCFHIVGSYLLSLFNVYKASKFLVVTSSPRSREFRPEILLKARSKNARIDEGTFASFGLRIPV